MHARAVADEAQIAAFERRCGVALPEDLRTYFTVVNGTEIGISAWAIPI